jgi:enoyl-CoA hydratase/carnithine racemase
MLSSEPVVLCEYRDSIAIVTLNRPQQRNCFNPEVIVHLATLWKEINANPLSVWLSSPARETRLSAQGLT